MRQNRDGATQIVDARPAPSGAGANWARVNWTLALIWFMRTMAWVWVVKGLFNWSVVLGANPRFGDFIMLPRAMQSTIVFFAAVDLLAAVGLWLAAPWGGVLWLLCAIIETISPLLGARAALVGALGALLNVVLVAAYFVLSWRAGLERN